MGGAKPFLSVYGHVTVDQIIAIKRFPEINESVDVISKSTTLGGTGTNIAMTAAKLGVPTAICAFVGQDFPVRYENDMKESGLIMDEFVHVNEYETSQAMVVNDSELLQRVIFYQGPQGSASKLDRLLNGNASRSAYVHFCTGEPDYYISVMGTINGGPSIAVDPAQEVYKMWDKAKFEKALPLSDSLFCNEYEARTIEKYLGIKDVMEVEKDLVVRTEGSKGSTAKIKGEKVSIPVVKGNAFVDATGAGDAFRAGFYCGLYNGYDVHRSLILASATSSFVVEKVGALTNIPRWEDVLHRADRYL
ncbi:putative sugar kinase [Candidatus Methanoplasma termitum]|uniref:Putative sugar kinase n=1 Tax=Candidatus Methanoplasma termitum TaxID=1577791 RepID=A0A0A7LDA3_9ARCH|nr:PfkB family carbohydrate kinase [Candidatus Methanoplasma termitum]AIZ57049.1 putative sugar kinase [Candidatus Methanoplasma termitum]